MIENMVAGSTETGVCGIRVDGIEYDNIEIITALAKALIKKGLITKAEIKVELEAKESKSLMSRVKGWFKR